MTLCLVPRCLRVDRNFLPFTAYTTPTPGHDRISSSRPKPAGKRCSVRKSNRASSRDGFWRDHANALRVIPSPSVKMRSLLINYDEIMLFGRKSMKRAAHAAGAPAVPTGGGRAAPGQRHSRSTGGPAARAVGPRFWAGCGGDGQWEAGVFGSDLTTATPLPRAAASARPLVRRGAHVLDQPVQRGAGAGVPVVVRVAPGGATHDRPGTGPPGPPTAREIQVVLRRGGGRDGTAGEHPLHDTGRFRGRGGGRRSAGRYVRRPPGRLHGRGPLGAGSSKSGRCRGP